jgi:multiple sugar transport system substrate-binding protein
MKLKNELIGGCNVKRFRNIPLTTAFALTLVGCSGGTPTGEGALKELGNDEKATIKVMFYDNNNFFQQYGNLFMMKQPNIDVEVVSTQGIYGQGKDPEKELQKLIDEEKPDVLFIQSPIQFDQLIQDNRLYALDDVIRQDKFDVENILPSVTETLKSKGGGKLYGLSPVFYSQALFYNKDLFEQHGVPLPKNQMSWEEILELAKRFPTDGQDTNRTYGFTYSYASPTMRYQYMSNIGNTLGLSFIDTENLKLTMNTDAWKKVLQSTIDALKSGALQLPPEQNSDPSIPRAYADYLRQNMFLIGKSAMTIDGYYLIDNLERAKETLNDTTPVNWDIVTVPVDPQNPGFSNSVSVSQIFAINGQSTNLRAAWEFIKFINSDELARIQSKSSRDMQSRTTYLKEKDGRSLEPFYMLKPNPETPYNHYENIPQAFFQPYSQLVEQELKAVMEGSQSVDDALKHIQDRGQEALIKAKQAQEQQDAAAKTD